MLLLTTGEGPGGVLRAGNMPRTGMGGSIAIRPGRVNPGAAPPVGFGGGVRSTLDAPRYSSRELPEGRAEAEGPSSGSAVGCSASPSLPVALALAVSAPSSFGPSL